jgi:type IV pilus assembly protein PilZ
MSGDSGASGDDERDKGNAADEAERRDGPRVPIELKVEYKRLNTFFADYTKNISKGGTFIKTRKPLDVGTEFVFKLVVPRLEQPLALCGQVKWVVKEGEPPPPGVDPDHEPGMGIRFIYASPDERTGIEQTVEKLMIDSLGQLLYSKLIGKDRAGGK